MWNPKAEIKYNCKILAFVIGERYNFSEYVKQSLYRPGQALGVPGG
jgi:hypothetical protein